MQACILLSSWKTSSWSKLVSGSLGWVSVHLEVITVAGSGSTELTLGAALIDFQGSVRGHSSLSRHPSGIYYPS